MLRDRIAENLKKLPKAERRAELERARSLLPQSRVAWFVVAAERRVRLLGFPFDARSRGCGTVSGALETIGGILYCPQLSLGGAFTTRDNLGPNDTHFIS
jgi:hypothetical protein